ncbi:HNH endonuclease family protein [Leifsonia sp. RAF41]|uniref:HNH endonuclease family protein n=1 Tax=Leifsonia sp. RAF41 TaxID=3233056 RepID=UPI003F9AE339
MTDSSPATAKKFRIIAGAGIGGALTLLIVLLSTWAGGATASPTASPTPTATATATPKDSGAPKTALEVLATIPVKGRAPATGYQRTADFGAAWLDVDRNGCDTRNDILARDLTGTVRKGRCTVLTGTLHNPYTGTTIAFVRGATTSALVQIDHIVPLQNAWVTGAQQLTQAQRISLANDPLNLLAVDGRSNQQKSAGDAATWLPADKSFRCEYVARQISVKGTYGLWVTSAEKAAMVRVLGGCPAQPAESSALAASVG